MLSILFNVVLCVAGFLCAVTLIGTVHDMVAQRRMRKLAAPEPERFRELLTRVYITEEVAKIGGAKRSSWSIEMCDFVVVAQACAELRDALVARGHIANFEVASWGRPLLPKDAVRGHVSVSCWATRLDGVKERQFVGLMFIDRHEGAWGFGDRLEHAPPDVRECFEQLQKKWQRKEPTAQPYREAAT